MSKNYRENHLKVLGKIYKKKDDCAWSYADYTDAEYKAIDYPKDAERLGNVYVCEYKKDFFVFTGAYNVRFYYDEEQYNFERRTFVAFVTSKIKPALITFISNEEENSNIFKSAIKKNMQSVLFGYDSRHSYIEEIYKSANYIANDLDSLYDDILHEDDDR
ncbi:hypothetical protein QNH25_08940 [Bacillus safensis]|uniref:hypothetical protein n=1 Tax=Bacillus TaxID=1386 RepID=UPI00119DC23C|nr:MULTISPECIES: hypothetical protein [Bacillus]MBI1630372.1 hypothetical protein [Bacillus safensis]MEC1412692.1 hypothetical protein [Bacillus safensis]WHX77051.1 hypothetical protein QNH25_08940 [Bacillus safensis]WHX84508.1 hypothetical protein QNH21_08925 [Bacillus safensis]